MHIKTLSFRVISFILSLLLLISILGCTSQTVETPNLSEESSDGESEYNDDLSDENSSSSLEFPITITDHLNRSLTFDTPPQRIVSGYYISSSMLMALGLQDDVVGIEARPETRPLYTLASPDFLELPIIGSMRNLDLEGIISLKPELVVLSVRLHEAIDTLSSLGIPVIGINPESTELLFEALEMIGSITGTLEQAQSIQLFYEDRLNFISALDIVSSPSVYFAGNSDFLSTVSNKMYQHHMIEQAGGMNVTYAIDDTYWATISYEQLIVYNPDIIIIAPGASYTLDDLRENDNIKDLTAIQSNQVYQMPSSLEAWDSPIPSGILGTLWLASIIYDEQYPFDAFIEDVSSFYQLFYGFEINPESITR